MAASTLLPHKRFWRGILIAKGFKRYFSLQAITATTNMVTLHKERVRTRSHLFVRFVQESYEEPPPEEELLALPKPCYCNIFFACQAHKALRLSRIKKPPLCRCRYTKTGVAPPVNLISSNIKTKNRKNQNYQGECNAVCHRISKNW